MSGRTETALVVVKCMMIGPSQAGSERHVMKREPGDSSEQQEAEQWLLDTLSAKLGVKLTKRRWQLGRGSWTELDGFSESPLILCEAWAHVGAPKSAQKNKVMTDAFKLLFVSRFLEANGRRILLFGDIEAARHFQGTSWMARCLRQYGIEVEVVDMSPELKARVVNAQERLYGGPAESPEGDEGAEQLGF
jgi:hypothetical protein